MRGASWELDWATRPREEAALFNPAFCGEIIARVVAPYVRVTAHGLSLPLAYLILPLTLAGPTRAALPRRSDTTFVTWAGLNRVLLAELPDRATALRPVTREALLFLAQHKAARLTSDGLVLGDLPLKLNRKLGFTTVDASEIRMAAGALGRWFAHQSGASQILQTMGVRP